MSDIQDEETAPGVVVSSYWGTPQVDQHRKLALEQAGKLFAGHSATEIVKHARVFERFLRVPVKK
jgi:hypothetical protein